MRNERDTKRAAMARFNQMRKALREMNRLTLNRVAIDDIENVDIGDMRDQIEQINQCFHEFSAYWNVVKT